MYKFKLASDIRGRLTKFIESDQFSSHIKCSKSAYWEHHADLLSVDVGEDSVSIAGAEGFYVPEPVSLLQGINRKVWLTISALSRVVKSKRVTRNIILVIKKPSRLILLFNYFITRKPGLLTSEKTFDAIMSCAQVSDPILSKFRINHLEMAKLKGVFLDSQMVKKHYSSWSGRAASDSIINHYYQQNIMRMYFDGHKNKLNTILDIGAGNGNLPSIFFHDWAPVRVIIVDLPETLAISIPYLSSQFPKAKIIMPHEVQVGILDTDFDFAFLTVDQLDYIDDDSIDLAINCDSFQEMTHEQIAIYFKLIQRVTVESGIFFTTNRVEKIPVPNEINSYNTEQIEPPNRFFDYPWNDKNEILAFEIDRFIRLVQVDDSYIRIERIRK